VNKDTLTLIAPAKINLFLHITGRQDNGYHQLQTLFQLLNYGDELHFQARRDTLITVGPSHPSIAQEDNLIYKAAIALQQLAALKNKHTAGADITLTKRLPLGGGLGGGSSDAATTLVALNHLWGLHFSLRQLSTLGLTLGADIPVFIHGRTAWAEGIGEELTAVDLPSCWYIVLIPRCQVSTEKIFTHEELTRDARPITIRAFLEQGGKNNCQPVAEMLYPEVHAARKWLEQYANAQMTGTGACVFAACKSEEDAHRIQKAVPERWLSFIAQGVNHSPLYRTPLIRD